MVDKGEDYERDVMGPGGLLEMARRFRSEGKARFISLSTHEQAIGLQAIESGAFDSIMVGHNLNWPQPKIGPACAGCGDCLERCPFKVDIPSEMLRATELFEGKQA